MIDKTSQEYIDATSPETGKRIEVARKTTNPEIIALLANDDNWYVMDALEKKHPNLKDIVKKSKDFSNMKKRWKQQEEEQRNNIIVDNPIEIDRNALNKFKNRWMKKSIGHERSETSLFWTELFTAIGLNPDRLLFEYKIRKSSGSMSAIDVFVPNLLLVEQKKPNKGLDAALLQAKNYYYGIDEEERPRFIIVCNFKNFAIIKVEKEKIESGEVEDDDGNIVWIDAHEKITFRKLTAFKLKNITDNTAYLNLLLRGADNDNISVEFSLGDFLIKAIKMSLKILGYVALFLLAMIGFLFAALIKEAGKKRR